MEHQLVRYMISCRDSDCTSVFHFYWQQQHAIDHCHYYQ